MPRFFSLGQAIGVDTSQRLDERGLAVVDVAGGGDDHGLPHPFLVSPS